MQNAEGKMQNDGAEGAAGILHFAFCGSHLSHIWIIQLFLSQSGRFSVAGIDLEIGLNGGKAAQGFENSGPVSTGQIRTATGACEQGIAGEHGVVNQQADGTGGMAGGVEDGNGKTCKIQLVALGVGMGIVQGPAVIMGGMERSSAQM